VTYECAKVAKKWKRSIFQIEMTAKDPEMDENESMEERKTD